MVFRQQTEHVVRRRTRTVGDQGALNACFTFKFMAFEFMGLFTFILSLARRRYATQKFKGHLGGVKEHCGWAGLT